MWLALESSCDETAVALFDPAAGLRAEWIHSQVTLHGRYGGVVPDLATREHLRAFGPLLARVGETVGWGAITHVAVTRGPGLAGCLAIGTAAAQSIAVARRIPLLGVNHLRGHAFSPFIPLHAAAPADFRAKLADRLPQLGLIVSGGNTLLFAIGEDLGIRPISSTLDDAAGEALDKGAKLLGLGYPGGPLIEREARLGRADAFDFPRGLGPRAELDFSFSGLKTSLRYRLEKMTPAEIVARRADLCASYQEAVIAALLRKTLAALERPVGTAYRSFGLSGGVANNARLRETLARAVESRGVPFLAAEPRHTGDNAGMIAFAAWLDPQATATVPGGLTIEPGLALA